MPLYGYARVSTLDQDLSIQRTALMAVGCEVIRAEKASGSRRDGRTELQVLLDFLRAGDTLVVTRIDRLARSLKDLQDIVDARSLCDERNGTIFPHEARFRGCASCSRLAAGRASGVEPTCKERCPTSGRQWCKLKAVFQTQRRSVSCSHGLTSRILLV